jgi:hypothetical protein
VSERLSLPERLAIPDALLSRNDLRDLGLGRRGVDAVFRAVATVHLEGHSRSYIRVADYLAHIAERSYDGRTALRPE